MSARVPRMLAALLLGFVLLGAAEPEPSSAVPASAALPGVTGADIPSEASATPKASEWKAARDVRLTRGMPGPCTFSVLREWLRVRCPAFLGGGLVAGDPKGVLVRATGNPFGDANDPAGAVNQAETTIVVPLQRGQVRVFSFLQLAEEYNSAASAEAGTLSVVWRSSQPDPVLLMTQVAAPSMF